MKVIFIGSNAGEGDDKVLRDESSWVFIGMGKEEVPIPRIK